MTLKYKFFGATLFFILLSLLVAYLVWSRPLQFERKYLHQTHDGKLNLRGLAQANNFYFGASTDKQQDLVSAHFANTFNSTTAVNRMKMGDLLHLPKADEPRDNIVYNVTETNQWINTALQQGLRVRGHTLVWGRLSDDYESPNLQPWLNRFTTEQEKKTRIRKFLESHIEKVLREYRGKFSQWDVVNEPLELHGEGALDENIYTRYLGEDYIEFALRHAHKIDPTIKLFINEQFNNYSSGKAQAFLQLVEKLLAQGVPLHGVGLQHHMLFHVESAASTQQFIQKLGKLGLEVEITELDARLRLFKNAKDPYLAQGQYYAEIVQVCLQLSHCKGVTFWGLDDRNSWHDELGAVFPKPNEPYLFDAQLNPKPGVKAIGEVLEKAIN